MVESYAVEFVKYVQLADGEWTLITSKAGAPFGIERVKTFDHYPTEEEINAAISMWERGQR